MKTNLTLEDMIDKINAELVLLQSGDMYEPERAKKTAALALMIQLELAKHLSSIQAQAKNSKNEVKVIEAEAYFEGIEGKDKKPSDSYLDNKVATSDKVKVAKKAYIDVEQESDKWTYVFNSMKDTHILFRSLTKELF